MINLFVGVLDQIRTDDVSLRRRTLYPAEVRGHIEIINILVILLNCLNEYEFSKY